MIPDRKLTCTPRRKRSRRTIGQAGRTSRRNRDGRKSIHCRYSLAGNCIGNRSHCSQAPLCRMSPGTSASRRRCHEHRNSGHHTCSRCPRSASSKPSRHCSSSSSRQPPRRCTLRSLCGPRTSHRDHNHRLGSRNRRHSRTKGRPAIVRRRCNSMSRSLAHLLRTHRRKPTCNSRWPPKSHSSSRGRRAFLHMFAACLRT
mmetsp:Transcript_34226/g.98691  ORF Transcript_34226/g.98691 Transcript_34226/m.98691 type:complete len:200 (+) Transcript_34226:565-1164(+)